MVKRRDRKHGQRGFTLIEIIAVLVILGILAVVAVPKYLDLQKQAAANAVQGAVAALGSQVSMDYANAVMVNPNAASTWGGDHDGPDRGRLHRRLQRFGGRRYGAGHGWCKRAGQQRVQLGYGCLKQRNVREPYDPTVHDRYWWWFLSRAEGCLEARFAAPPGGYKG